MSKSSCPWCNHSNITAEGRNHYCNYCGYEWQSKPTIFDTITASPETLAEKFVIKECNRYGGYSYKAILLVDENGNCRDFYSREKAIAATVARLKEVYNG